MSAQEIQKFRESIEPFIPAWKSIEIRAIADLDTSVLLSAVACFSLEEPRPTEVMDPIQGIAFIRDAVPMINLNHVLNAWDCGSIILGNHELSTIEFSESRFIDLSDPSDDLVRGWPDYRIYRQFELRAGARRSLDVIIQPKHSWSIARALGYREFAELTLDRVQFQAGGSYVSRMEIFAPMLASVDTEVDSAAFTIMVDMHSALKTYDLSATYRVQDEKGNRLDGGQIELGNLDQNHSGSFFRVRARVELPENVYSGEVNIFHAKYRSKLEPIETHRFTVPPEIGATNPRWNSVLSLIGNTRKWTKLRNEPLDVLEQWLGLASPRPESSDFERGVSCLLFAAGLNSLSIGEAEGVDLAVWTNGSMGSIVLGSCTTSSNMKEKISDLLLQRNKVADTLDEIDVYGVIFAPVDQRDLTIRDQEECHESNVRLVLRKELRELLDGVRGKNWKLAGSDFVRKVIQQNPRHPI